MTKPPKRDQEDEAVIMERMDKALKKMLSTPPETHKEMVKRRRGRNRNRPERERT